MSSPMTGSYAVESAEMRERRRREAALGRSERVRADREAVAASMRARKLRNAPHVNIDLGADLRGGRDAATEVIEAWCDKTSALVAAAASEIARSEQAERAQALADTLAAIEASPEVAEIRRKAAASRAERPAMAQAQPSRHPVADNRAAQEAALFDEIEREVASLDPMATEEERMEIDESAQRAAAGDTGPAGIVDLRARVQTVGRAAEKRRRAADQAWVLIASLDGLGGKDVESVKALLGRVQSGGTTLLQSDRERVQRVRAAAEREAERKYVAEAVAAAFSAAGTPVGPGFGTTVLKGDPVFVAARESSEHAVEVRLRPGFIDFRVVRASGVSDAGRDTKAQEDACRTLDILKEDLNGRGVDIALMRQAPAGSVEVDVVPEAAAALRRRGAAGQIHRSKPR